MQVGFVFRPPQADAARLADRAPQADEVARGREFLGAYRLSRAARVHFGRTGAFGDGRGDLDDEFLHGPAPSGCDERCAHRAPAPGGAATTGLLPSRVR